MPVQQRRPHAGERRCNIITSTAIRPARCGITTTLDITGCPHPFESVLTRNKETLLAGWITQFLIALSPDLRELTTESVHQDLPLFFAHSPNTINNELEEKSDIG